MKKIILAVSLLITIVSCSNQKETETKAALTVPVKDSIITQVTFTPAMVDNKRDFSCGMSVKSGIEDTCHYKGKVYGFCCTECKVDFLKKPESYLSKK